MKLSSKLARLKLNKTAPRPALKPAPGKGRSSTLRKWTAIVFCLLLAGGGTWAVLAIFVWEKLPPALIGKWEVQEGPMKGGTFDFSRDGTMEIRTADGQPLKARAAVEGKTLLQTTRNDMTKQEETHKSTIQELTATSLVLELEWGTILRMARAK